MRNLIVSTIVALVIMTGFSSCKVLGDLFGESTVITSETELVEGEVGTPIPYDQLPEDVKRQVPEGTVLVLADKEQLKEEAAYIPVSPPGDGDMGGILDALIALGVTFVPGLAAWEGVLTVISRRKRKNYAKAIKALAPTDSNVDLAGTIHGIGAALGVVHTSEASKEAAEEEEELV
jgi:hypothetical protein